MLVAGTKPRHTAGLLNGGQLCAKKPDSNDEKRNSCPLHGVYYEPGTSLSTLGF